MIFAHQRPDETHWTFVKTDQRNLWVPIYSTEEVNPGFCAKYARLAAAELFGVEFSTCAAWERDLFDSQRLSYIGHSLSQLVKEGPLNPGTIIGVFNPKSKHYRTIAESGREIPFTHNALILGTSSGIALVAEQIGSTIFIRNERELRAAGFVPAEAYESSFVTV